MQDLGIVKKLRILLLTYLPKSKSITTGIFYRHPKQANFMELISKSFPLLNLKDNEINLLGDFNINLLQKGNIF